MTGSICVVRFAAKLLVRILILSKLLASVNIIEEEYFHGIENESYKLKFLIG